MAVVKALKPAAVDYEEWGFGTLDFGDKITSMESLDDNVLLVFTEGGVFECGIWEFGAMWAVRVEIPDDPR